MLLFILFVFVPLLEIALFIQVGGWLSLWPTLGIVVVTAIIGVIVLRRQGARALFRIRTSVEQLRDTSGPLADGAMILFAGVLLVTPGFLTDTVGFLLLVPQVRQLVYRQIATRIKSGPTVSATRGRYRESEVVEADYRDVTPTDEPEGRISRSEPASKNTSEGSSRRRD